MSAVWRLLNKAGTKTLTPFLLVSVGTAASSCYFYNQRTARARNAYCCAPNTNSENDKTSNDTTPEKKRQSWCPFARAMFYFNGDPLELPFGHPTITQVEGDEPMAEFNVAHYPNGVNANFLNSTGEDLSCRFGGPKGIFEDVEGREIARYKDGIVAVLKKHGGMCAGAKVADIGFGTGDCLLLPVCLFCSRIHLFTCCESGILTKSMSESVGPEGKVFAEELSQGFIDAFAAVQKADPSLANVQIVKGTARDAKLPVVEGGGSSGGGLDMVLICDVYHHFEYPQTILSSIRRSLSDTGTLVVIDFHRDESKIWSRPKGWVTDHVRADKATFTQEILSAGFVLSAEPQVEGMRENYIMVFRRQDLRPK